MRANISVMLVSTSLPTVSKRLGHADSAITAKVYAHCLPEDDGIAAEIWNAARRKMVAEKKAEEDRTLANVSLDVPSKRLTLVRSGGYFGAGDGDRTRNQQIGSL